MADKLDDLARQREALAAEIEMHRQELARAALMLQRPLRRIDGMRKDLRYLRERYAMLLLPLVLLVILNPQRTMRLLLSLWTMWRGFQRTHGIGGPETRMLQTLIELAARRS